MKVLIMNPKNGTRQFIRSTQAAQYAKGLKVKNSGSGAGSMLIAYGQRSMIALQDAEAAGIGKIYTPFSDWKSGQQPCPESSPFEMNVSECGSGVIQAAASHCEPSAVNENSPRYDKTGQGILFKS